ncbi:MAG: alpha/beta hydrolase [Halioglobus sp.]|nr:alpha/beta hydrolase [Halioglobus sp.]
MTVAINVRLEVDDDVSLAAEVWGDPDHPPVLLSHGGGQTRYSWQGTAGTLAARGWHVVNYDHRGHGESDWSPDGEYSLEIHAADQRQVARSFARPPVLVGASLGGLSALLAQGESAEQLYRAIILVDITPHMNQEGAQEIMDFMESTQRDGFATLEEAAEAIAGYTGRRKRVNPQGLEKNLRLGEDGKYRWHWDPRFLSLRGDATGQPERLAEATRNIELPLMLVRGRESNVVTEQTARQFLELRPDAAYVDVADARHMVVGDRNEIFTDAVLEFLDSLD